MNNTLPELSLDPQSGVTLAEQLHQQITWLITSGQIVPGQSLPSVRKLAGQLGINLHTIRKAYQKLAADGFVEIQQGKQAVVLAYTARHLAGIAGGQSSHTIGVILPNLANPFYHDFLDGVDEVARQSRSMIFTCSSNEEPQEAFRYLAQLAAKHVDGILVVSQPLEAPAPAPAAGLPIVHVDWPEAKGAVVLLDLESAGYAATRHLLEHGHRRVGLITFDQERSNIQPVNRGYMKALGERGIGPDQGLIARVDGFDLDAGERGAGRLLRLEAPPTALFAISDTLALGAMKAIRAAGMRVPQEVAVAGFNDIVFAGLTDPPLTTVAAPVHEMGMRAMEMLQELIAGKTPARTRVVLKTELIIRQSCGCS